MKIDAHVEFGFGAIVAAVLTALIGTTIIANAISSDDETEPVEFVETNNGYHPVCKCDKQKLPHLHLS